MEIKIRYQGKLTDATIEVVDGVMIVSPKEEKYEPKDGDVVYSGGFYDIVFIYKDNLTAEAYYYVSLYLKDNKIELPDGGHIGYVNQLRPATEEEKKKLFDKIKEEGYEWDANKKELVKLRWKPENEEEYYTPFFDALKFILNTYVWEGEPFDFEMYDKGWVFRTEIECLSFCDKLNQAINQIKP